MRVSNKLTKTKNVVNKCGMPTQNGGKPCRNSDNCPLHEKVKLTSCLKDINDNNRKNEILESKVRFSKRLNDEKLFFKNMKIL